MKVAGDVRMRAAFEEIARLVDGVKSIPDCRVRSIYKPDETEARCARVPHPW